MRGKDVAALVVFLVLSLTAGGIGGFWTAPATASGGWYYQIEKPSWTPPSWLFGPVWTMLYIAMGVAAWLVWRRGGWEAQRIPLTFWLVQLVLNTLWSGLFFGLRSLALGALEIVFLWIAILMTILVFRPVSRAAAWLMAPYLLWVTFAAALTFAVWRLNP